MVKFQSQWTRGSSLVHTFGCSWVGCVVERGSEIIEWDGPIMEEKGYDGPGSGKGMLKELHSSAAVV